MATSVAPKVVIVNRNYPPRPGVTGASACLLAGYLADQHEMQISVVTVRSKYAGDDSSLSPVGEVHDIASLYDGKNKLIRLAANFIESGRLIWRAKRLNGSTTIVMTDPPFLSAWAALLLRSRHWGLYAMDLYPNAFESGKLVSKGNLIYRLLHWLVYRRTPSYLISLGPLQAEFLAEEYGKAVPTALLPCGVYDPVDTEVPKWKSDASGKIVVGYCGNLGEAHSVNFVKSVIDNLDGTKFHFVLSVYGSKASELSKYVEDKGDILTVVESVSRDELSSIDIHLVSLLRNWAHVCVPSKAVSAVCSGSTFMFYGVKDCDNWHLLREAGWFIDESASRQGIDQQVSSFLERVDATEIDAKRERAKEIRRNLRQQTNDGLLRIANFVNDTSH